MNSKEINHRLENSLVSISEAYFRVAKLSGVTENLFWLLVALNDCESYTQKEICELWGLPKTTVNTLVKKMESQGYIELITIPDRKRDLRISLTASGKSYADNILTPMSHIELETLKRVKKELPESFIEDLAHYSVILNEIVSEYETKS